MSLHAKPPEIFRPVNVKPSGCQLDAEPAIPERPQRIAESGACGPSNALEHVRGRPAAGDAVEPAIIHRAKAHIGTGGQQSADVRCRQAWGVAAQDERLGPSRRERLFQSGVDSFPQLAGILNRARYRELKPCLCRLVSGEFYVRFATQGVQHGQRLANKRGVKLDRARRVNPQARLHPARRRSFREQNDHREQVTILANVAIQASQMRGGNPNEYSPESETSSTGSEAAQSCANGG